MPKKNIYKLSPWSLKDLFESLDDPEIERTYTKLEGMVKDFEKFRPELKPSISAKRFMEILVRSEMINKLIYRLYGMAELSFSADTQNQKALTAIARIGQFAANAANRMLFVSLWWKDLDDKNAARLLKSSGDYRYWLEQMRSFKPFTLSEAEEKVLNIKNVTGATALNTLYDSITNRYVFKVLVGGEEKKMTRGELMALVHSEDADLRARAYQELYRVYGEDAPILGQIYQNLVRDWRNENVDLRNYNSPISVRNRVNDLPDEVIDTLINVARKNVCIFHRYFKVKAKALGVKKLRRYDIYAPVAKADKHYDFNEGAKLTFEAFTRFDPQFTSLAKRVFDEQHIDSEVRKGKRSGAFCATIIPDLTPWVLLNYQGKMDDVSTMAHELGHAIHSMLAEKHSLYTQHACLPLAETASTFGEMMLTDLILEREENPAVRKDILFRQLDDAFATVLRQIYFAIFEREAHDMIAEGASVDELSEAYLKNLQEEFGKSVDVSEEFKYEWVSIPHIFSTPFYVYAYSFGQLLVYALYKRYQDEGESFKPKYLRLLSAGGSVAPIELLQETGMDVTQEAFWQGGFDLIDDMVRKLEKLK